MSIRHPLAVFFCLVMAVALLWSRALLSITTVILAVVASVDIQIQPLKIKWLLTPTAIRESIRAKPFLWVFSLFFFLYLISVVYAGNLAEWWSLTHMKIPFLILPLAFAMLNPFTKREYMLILLSMVFMTVWSSIWVQVSYYENFYLFNKSLGFGGALPTPTGYIRYSIIVALSMVLCLSFAIEDVRYKFPWERWVYGFLALYLFYFLHILSVRSGLVIGYAGILILCGLYVRHLHRWKQFAMLALLILAPIIAYKALPGFEQKVNYTIYDFGRFQQGLGEQYSDSERWQSWRAGLVIGNKHPFFGTGTGNFRAELKQYYQDVLKKDSWVRPHNQFINVFTLFGLTGLAVFLFTLIYPSTFRFFWDPPLLPAIFFMQIISMMVEHPLDTVNGTTMFLLTVLMSLSYQYGLSLENSTSRQVAW